MRLSTDFWPHREDSNLQHRPSQGQLHPIADEIILEPSSRIELESLHYECGTLLIEL